MHVIDKTGAPAVARCPARRVREAYPRPRRTVEGRQRPILGGLSRLPRCRPPCELPGRL